MKIKIFTVGKLSLKPVKVLQEEYLKRIGHYLPVEMVVLKSQKEGLEKIKPQDQVVILDERGKLFSSMEWAKWLEGQKLHSVKNLVFFIGPAEGFEEEIKKRGNLLLGLSKMTLQHELALVVLLEQIYRACTILKGEPYHK
ncbi:MAG: 23S rRNA (pseudouridine(1915)-N(3))-methyltransferase RlmH [Deltaproteobacteria bacterium]|nr:23S rRNA (pseudouridine(1915)-N(3))-methyltransferase RlmH [Deltaproteobacteria bacterium]